MTIANEENNSSEQNEQKSDEGKSADATPSKAEFDKLHSELESTRKQLEDTKMSALDPDYLKWLEERDTKANAPKLGGDDKQKLTDYSPEELEAMPRSKFMELVIKASSENIINRIGPVLEEEIGTLKSSVQTILADAEVARCAKKYSDFWEYKDDMMKILNSDKQNKYTIEDAYQIAKGRRVNEKSAEDKQRAVRSQTEKPSTTAKPTESSKTFKSKQQAHEDAWSKVMGDAHEL